MPDEDDRAYEALSHLLDAYHLAPVDDLVPLAAKAAERMDLRDLTVYLLDYAQELLVPVPRHLDAGPHPALSDEAMPIEGTMAGRALATQQLLVSEGEGDRPRVLLPLVDGTERVGLVAFSPPRADDDLVPGFRQFGALLAALVVAKAPYGDLVSLVRRRRPMTLAAEMQWRNLPPLTHVTPQVTVAGVLEPAYGVGGDVFDYALNGDTLHVGLFDAMGHGLDACVMSTVALAAYRHHRRLGHDLATNVQETDRAVAGRFGMDSFTTAQLATLDVEHGRLRWVNAGHPAPLLVRANRVVGSLPSDPTLPLGLGADLPQQVSVAEVALEPGDALVFYTDGMVEARLAGEEFGLERLTDWLHRELDSGMPFAEVLRRLARAVLEHHKGRLQDDATLVAVHWRGGDPATEPALPGRANGRPQR